MTPFFHDKQIVHCVHHKTGTAWTLGVIQDICSHYGLTLIGLADRWAKISDYDQSIIFHNHSRIIFDTDDYLGSHLIRDPRDVIISGYFYHLWTNESWVHVKSSNWNMTYQEKLNSLSKDQGILLEMETVGGGIIKDMIEWNYYNPKILEMQYEYFIMNSDEGFTKLFNHWGVVPECMEECLNISRKHYITAKTGRKLGDIAPKSHMRSGEPGQWKLHFTDEHKSYFKESFGDALIFLHYEKGNDW